MRISQREINENVNIRQIRRQSLLSIFKVPMKGTVSQILYLGLSFYFMKSRKLSFKNEQKLPVSLDKIKTRA